MGQKKKKKATEIEFAKKRGAERQLHNPKSENTREDTETGQKL